MRRWALRRFKRRLGFPAAWISSFDALYEDIRIYYYLDGEFYRGQDMTEGMIQGCSTSTFDMPLLLELFIAHVNYVLLSAQLSTKFSNLLTT